ncbi:MAG: GFA family protein [Sphingobium sp.]
MAITGKCLFGSVRLEIAAQPMAARLCWCRLCQSLAAGNATVNIVFPSEAVTTTGDVRWYESIADSGNAMRRGFCPQCGTPVFSIAKARPHLTIVRAGALDDPELLAPQTIIWTDSAPGWARLDPDLTHVAGQPEQPPAKI